MSLETPTIITNVRVFDGDQVLDGRKDVTILGGRIQSISPASPDSARQESTADSEKTTVDGSGCTLLPGLIDSHVHVLKTGQLDKLASAGVTTAMDMGSWPAPLMASLRAASRANDAASAPRAILYCAGLFASGPNSTHSKLPGAPPEVILTSPDQAEAFVAQRIIEGSDHIKLIADDVPGNGPSQETLKALVDAAAAKGKKTVIHAASHEAFRQGLECGADCLTHVPKDRIVDSEWAERLATQKRVVCPTLVMMDALISRFKMPQGGSSAASATAALAAASASSSDRPRPDYAHCRESLRVLADAGVQILAGTDAVDTPFIHNEHGTSMHQELVFMREAGIKDVDVLRSATSLPAQFWALEGRGFVRSHACADLLLVRGQPDQDVGHIANVEGVWIGGRRVVEV